MSYIKHFLAAREEARKKRRGDYNYEVADRLRIEYIYSKKDLEVRDNTNMFVDVKSVRIPPNNAIIMCPYMRHNDGAVVAVGEETFLPITSERSIDRVIFCVARDGNIKKGELIGAVILIPIDEAD